MIHRTAIIHPEAYLEADVEVGPYSVLGPGVMIGTGCQIGSHVVIERNTRIGKGCRIYSHAVLGGDPQDLSYKGEPTYCEIGERNVLREHVTVSRGCHGEGITRIGNECMLMAGVHVAHDCQVGSNVIMANLATLAGHVTVDDRVVIGGLAAFHQFVRVGRQAMVGGTAGVMQDVPPYCTVQGAPPATVRGLNLVGLKRGGVDEKGITALKHAFRLMFRRGMLKENAVAEIEASVDKTLEVRRFIEFIRQPSKRGICKASDDRFSVIGNPPPSASGAGEAGSASLEALS